MVKCSECDEEVDIPFKCKFCGEVFCSTHRLPENHDCVGLDRYEEKAQKDSKVIYEPFQAESPSSSSSSGLFSSLLGKISKKYHLMIIFICILVFLVQSIGRRAFPEVSARILQNLLIPLEVGGALQRPWTFLTAVFFHLDLWHLFVNMFVLFFFGRELEKRIGSKKFLEIFLVAGIVGSLGFVLALSVFGVPSETAEVALGGRGASGAIFGVLGTLAIIAPSIRVFIFPIPVPVKIRYFLVAYALLDLLLLGTGGMLGSAGHLFGLVAGVLYGYRIKDKEVGGMVRRLTRRM